MSSNVRKTLPRASRAIPSEPAMEIAEPLVTVNAKVTSKLPAPVQILLVTVISFSTSFVLFQSVGGLTGNELATVSRRPETTSDFALFPALRILELAVGWFAGFDDYDIASLALQTRLPYYFLLTTFYSVSLQTCAIALAFDMFSAALPFSLLRNRIPAHNSKAPQSAVANRGVVHNFTLNLLVTLFAAAIYSVIMYISYHSWLPVYLIGNFEGVRTFEAAHNSQLPVLVLTFFPLGWTAKILLFAPATGAQPDLGDAKAKSFNPATATLKEHLGWNLWGWSKGTKVMLKRTVVLATSVFFTTWIKTWKTLEGSELLGSAGWAALWALASLLNGALLRWVGDV